MTVMKPDLDRLHRRLQHLDKLAAKAESERATKEGRNPVKEPVGVAVLHVDNCCKVRRSLKSTFGDDIFVLLDEFHWQKRWDDILFDTKSPEAATF